MERENYSHAHPGVETYYNGYSISEDACQNTVAKPTACEGDLTIISEFHEDVISAINLIRDHREGKVINDVPAWFKNYFSGKAQDPLWVDFPKEHSWAECPQRWAGTC